jgi:hypothetical protein
MMVVTRDCLSHLLSYGDGVDGEDEDDEETQWGQLSEDDEPGWVMGTSIKMVQQHMETYWEK